LCWVVIEIEKIVAGSVNSFVGKKTVAVLLNGTVRVFFSMEYLSAAALWPSAFI